MTTPRNQNRLPNPYVGPKPFTEDEKGVFCGRDAEIQQIASLVIAHREVVLYSPSGAGKSSLLRAGVFPALAGRGINVLPVARVVGSGAPSGVPIQNIFTYNVLSAWAPKAMRDQLPSMTFVEFFKAIAADEVKGPRLHIAVLDQFEELFTSYRERWQEREKFLADLGEALEQCRRVRVLFAMREEYVGRLKRHASSFPEHLRTWIQLDRLRDKEAVEAVETPAKVGGIPFAAGVAQHLIDRLATIRVRGEDGALVDLSGEFVEPVQVQIVCHRLWERLADGTKEITEADLKQHGDVDDALKAYIDDQIDAVARASRVSRRKLVRWFDRHLLTEDGRRARVFESDGEVGNLPREVAVEFQRRYVLRADIQGEVGWFELAHDRLIAPVQRLADAQRRSETPFYVAAAVAVLMIVGVLVFVTFQSRQQATEAQARTRQLELETQTRRQAVERVRAVADQANQSTTPANFLVPLLGASLRAAPVLAGSDDWLVATDALRWIVSNATQGSGTEIVSAVRGDVPDFVGAANFSSDGKRLAVWTACSYGARAAPTSGRSATIRRGMISVFDTSTSPFKQLGSTEHAHRVAGVLVGNTGRVLLIEPPGLPQIGDLVTVKVPVKGKSSETERVELQLSESAGASPGLLSVAYAARRGLVATGAWDGSTKIWNATERRELRALSGTGPTAWDVTFNHAESILATTSRDGSVTLWDTEGGRQLRVIRAHQNTVRRVAFSPDDAVLATAGWDNELKTWDVRTGVQRAVLRGHTKPVNAVAFSPSGQEIASGASDGTIRIWNGSGALLRTVRVHKRSVRDVAFSPRGDVIASAAADRTVQVWETATGRVRRTLTHPSTVWTVAFDSTGDRLVTAGEDGITRVWETSTGKALAMLGASEQPRQPANEAFFTPDDSQVVTVSTDDSLRWWNWRTSTESAELFGHATAAAGGAITMDPQGTVLAILDRNRTVRIVEAKTERVLRMFPTQQSTVTAAQFSPDGKVLVTTGSGPAVKLWDVASGRELEASDAQGATFRSPAFDATGSRIAMVDSQRRPVVLTRGNPPVLLRLTPIGDDVNEFAFSPDGTLLAGVTSGGAANDEFYIWSLKTGYVVASLRIANAATTLAFSPAGDAAYAATFGGLQQVDIRRAYESDNTEVLAAAFEALPDNRDLNRAIATGLRGKVTDALAAINALPAGSPDRATAERLKLVEHLRQGTFGADALAGLFPAP